jgi:hypothetical protein
MNFLPMMGFNPLNTMNSFGFPAMGGTNQGMQTLLGNMMGGSFVNSGFSMQNNMTAMMQQLKQFFAQQQQQGMQAFSTWQANLNRATFQPDENQSPGQQFRALQKFARENGSRDGTPVADWTDHRQDLASAQYLDELYGKQSDLLLDKVKKAPLPEQLAVRAEELKLQKQAEAREAQGKPMTSREQMLARQAYLEKLYQAGQVSPDIGQANRDLTAIQECADQTWANAFLKNRIPTPSNMAQEYIDRSPYNPNNARVTAP